MEHGSVRKSVGTCVCALFSQLVLVLFYNPLWLKTAFKRRQIVRCLLGSLDTRRTDVNVFLMCCRSSCRFLNVKYIVQLFWIGFTIFKEAIFHLILSVNQLLKSLSCCPQELWVLLQQEYNSPNKTKVLEVSNYHENSPWENVFIPKNREQCDTQNIPLLRVRRTKSSGWYINQLRQILGSLIPCSLIHFILHRKKKTQNKTTNKSNNLWIKSGILIMQSSIWSHHVQLLVKAPQIFNP